MMCMTSPWACASLRRPYLLLKDRRGLSGVPELDGLVPRPRHHTAQLRHTEDGLDGGLVLVRTEDDKRG